MIKWSAVFVSWVVDIGGSSAFGFVLLTAWFATGLLPMSLAADSKALTAALFERPDLFAVSMAGGTFFSLLAGYVGARLAGRAFLLHGLLSSVACLASDLASREQLLAMPVWLAALGIVLAPLAGVAGGYVRQLQVRRVEPTTA